MFFVVLSSIYAINKICNVKENNSTLDIDLTGVIVTEDEETISTVVKNKDKYIFLCYIVKGKEDINYRMLNK